MYLIEILHQTTTVQELLRKQAGLYLIEILHQTTTLPPLKQTTSCCILSKFYIKPQLRDVTPNDVEVVSYRNSTSNHNTKQCRCYQAKLYLIEILHQTTTRSRLAMTRVELYLIEILHQTTTSEDSFLFCYTLYLIEILHQTTTTARFQVVLLQLYLIEILHQTTTAAFS